MTGDKVSTVCAMKLTGDAKKLTLEMTPRREGECRMKPWIIFSFMWAVVWSVPAIGENLKPEPIGKANTLLYRFNLELLYLTDIRGFSSKSPEATLDRFQDDGFSPYADTASIGLAGSEFDLSWYVPRGAGVEIALRSDALNAGAQSTELDSRSGQVVEAAPSVHFLDEYRIVIKRPSLESHLGVVNRTFEDYSAMPELLGFGLRVQGPRKFFALGFSTSDLFRLGSSTEGGQGAIGVGFDILSGRDDRHDARTGSSSESGESPAKREPYWGGAANMSLKYGDGFKVGFTASAVQERGETGMRQVEWYQLALRRTIESTLLPRLTLGMEGRQLKQTYDKAETKIANVHLTSIGFNSSVAMPGSEKLFIGVWFGTGAIHPKGVLSSAVTARGMQSVIGWSWMLEDQLELVTAASREWRRDGNVGGGSRGGFGEGSSGRSSQSRFALKIIYTIGDQI